ncbi:THAP domain-containing protein 1-like [Hydra vulgaris]|uniref:THAP domain-containing protein 1-like n=1 Tax=Hydra vulgaris TaxID=6087 RepID=A0ABM4CAY8_HYDVU
MVNSCAAYDCSNRYIKGGTKSFHKFPLQNSELCKRWIVALKRENFLPSKHTCICSDHFLESDYNYCIPDKKNPSLDHHQKPILKCNAVPSVFIFSTNIQKTKRKLPSIRTSVNSLSKFDPLSKKTKFDVYPAIDKPSKEINLTHNDQPENTIEKNDHTSQSPTQSIRSLSPAKEKLKKKVKALQQKLRRKEKKICSLQDMVSLLKSKNYLTTDAATVLSENFSGLSYEIIKNQFSNQNVKPKGHRYNDEVKKFALILYFYSPRAFNFLRPMLCLPAASSISHWTSSVNCNPGLFLDVFS